MKISMVMVKMEIMTMMKMAEKIKILQVLIMQSNTDNVFFSSLLPLFCLKCRAPALIEDVSTRGTTTYITLCEEGHLMTWKSQLLVYGAYASNLSVAPATLFSGNTYNKVWEIPSILKL